MMNGIRFRLVCILFGALFSGGATFATENNPEPTPLLVAAAGAFGRAEKSEGNDFVATFYDFSTDRRDRPIHSSLESYQETLTDFISTGFYPSKFARFSRPPKKLYSNTIMVSSVRPSEPSNAFGKPSVQCAWAVLYKGKLVHKDAITFRFWGVGDDFMGVWVDGNVVLNAYRRKGPMNFNRPFSSVWESSSPDSEKYDLGNGKAVVGDWITLAPGVPLDMRVVTGNALGGPFSAMLWVEVEGVEYEKNSQGGPILPVFKTANLSLSMQDAICWGVVAGGVSVVDGPVFSMHTSPLEVAEMEPSAPRAAESSDGLGMRSWTADSGKTLEAKFIKLVGDHVVLEDSNGKQRRIPLNRFSAEDQGYIELAYLLKFEVDFIQQRVKQTDSAEELEHLMEKKSVLDFYEYVFRVELKQTSLKNCTQELQVEFYVMADEREGSRHFLLDRQEGRFIPSKSSAQAFSTKTVLIPSDDLYDVARDEGSFSYLVVLSDEQGRVVQHVTSDEWLFNKLGNLRKIPVGAYMDKTCTRTLPSGLRSKND